MDCGNENDKNSFAEISQQLLLNESMSLVLSAEKLKRKEFGSGIAAASAQKFYLSTSSTNILVSIKWKSIFMLINNLLPCHKIP